MLLQRTVHTETSDLAHAELAERAILQRGLNHFDAIEFDLEGTSVGVASWSGIVYFPWCYLEHY
jgi:hypothetical protein